MINMGYYGQNSGYFPPNYQGAYTNTPTVQNAPQAQMAPPTGNMIYVTSLQDALGRYSQPNTLMIYILQDESLEYEVFTDMQGKKSYKAYERKVYVETPKKDEKIDLSAYVTRDELAQVIAQIKGAVNNAEQQ